MFIKIAFAILLTTCMVFPCSGQDSTKQATVYFMRASGATVIGALSAFIDDSIVCRLNNNRFSIHHLPPGLHSFRARLNGNKPKKRIPGVALTLAAGEKYYLVTDVLTRAYWGELSVIEVTANTAKKMLADLKEDIDCTN